MPTDIVQTARSARVDECLHKTFFMEAEPVGVDATIFAFLAGTLCPVFDTPIRIAAELRQ
jgi:hypothetical protein